VSESKIPNPVRRKAPVYKACREQSIPLIINIAFMNFYIDLSRVALHSYPLYRPPKEHPIMKRQLLLSLTLSMLASTAFALPAAEQAIPQAKDSHSVFSQTLAEGGNDRLKEKGLITEDGYDQTKQGQTVAADGSDRTPGQTVAADGSDRTPGQTVAADGSDRTPGQTVAADGSDRTPGQTLAEGGGDRVIERNSTMS
jgi:hypothetical protein